MDYQEGPHRLASIPAGESIIIVQKMSGCYEETEHRFELIGGELITIEIDAIYTDLLSEPGDDRSSTGAGTLELTRATGAKLDSLFDIYRSISPSSSYKDTIDIRIEWPDGDETLQVTRIWDEIPESETLLSLFDVAKMARTDIESLRDG